jgi:hypothetical protein
MAVAVTRLNLSKVFPRPDAAWRHPEQFFKLFMGFVFCLFRGIQKGNLSGSRN